MAYNPFQTFGSLVGQLAGTFGYVPGERRITSVSPKAWPNPLQPIVPIGPPGSKMMAFPFLMGQNLAFTPRFDDEYSSSKLKSLAAYPLADACINNVKDQVCQTKRKIQLREKTGESPQSREKRGVGDPIIMKLSRFFEKPDGEHMWQEWLRPFIDACLVTDSGAMEPMLTSTGRMTGLSVLLGSDTIARYIDDTGRTPAPPDPAYSQNWEGMPRIEATADELIYKPRNIQPRNTISSYLYGRSAVAQCAPWIEIGIARLAFVAAYYRSGSIPDMIQVAPKSVTLDNIKEASGWFNSEFSGQLDKRRGLSIIQGFQPDGKDDQFLFPKQPLLADTIDDLLIRMICFTIGTSAQRLQRPMNRGSATAGQDAAEEEGTKPITNWVKAVIDQIIQQRMGYTDYEMAFDLDRENDVLKSAQAAEIRVINGIATSNEVRNEDGKEPFSDPAADQLWVKTAQGAVKLGEVLQQNDPGAPPAKKRLIERGDPTPMFPIQEPVHKYTNGHA